MIQRFYSNAKLLLSGEYLVLEGAAALVIPLRFGMRMKVESIKTAGPPMIRWRAENLNQPWFLADIKISDWTLAQTTDAMVARRLVVILKNAALLNKKGLIPAHSYNIVTESDFDMNWGFGSSSALIANVANWTNNDPFELYFRVSDGSGADIAAAVSSGPILYKLEGGRPVVTPVHFRPRFHRYIRFLYLGKKQPTEVSVSELMSTGGLTSEQVTAMNRLTDQMVNVEDVSGFARVVREHEILMQGILGRIRIKEDRFPDFPGEIKSLGAWGGDFAMVVSKEEEKDLLSYFSGKGLNTLFPFEEIIFSETLIPYNPKPT